MIARLRQAWSGRPPRERQVLVALAATVAVAAWLALVLAAQSTREPLLREVQALRDVSAGMDRQARELDQLRRLPAPAATAGSLRERVQAALDAGLPPGSVTRLGAPDPRHVVVVFDAVAFDAWLRWVDDLAGRGVRLESCRIEALPAAGQAGITATLVPSGPP